MGKKVKTGKSRKDKFYHLAKETGFRSRAAFKLIQLNRKYEFLQKSNVIIDLCAAPGGWLQVAAQNAPMSNHIIGIDLVAIPPIRNVRTFQEDITTEKCRQTLRKELHTVKADLFLNDGAPNLGKNWIHDAFAQVELTLHAMKLATEFLRKGGWFVTKLFRSKDYNSLMWVFQQLFKDVHATKPQASRNESAEIFVVCQGYLAPDKIDPKFTDPKYVFQEVDTSQRRQIDLIHPEKKRRQREGYPEGDYTLFHTLPMSQFLASDDYMTLLSESSEINLDVEEVSNHPLTTPEIRECIKDIKLLGKREIKLVFAWRNKLKKELEKKEEEPSQEETEKPEAKPKTEDEVEEEEMAQIEQLLEEKNLQELKAMKKAKKKVHKAQMKQKLRIDMKMAIPGDKPDIGEDPNMFDIKKIRNKMQLTEVEKGDLSHMDAEDIFEESDDDDLPRRAPREHFDRDQKRYVGVDDLSEGEDEMEMEEPDFVNGDAKEVESEEEDDGENSGQVDSNPLVVDLGVKESVRKSQQASWFMKSAFADLEKEDDEDVELSQLGLSNDNKKANKRTKKSVSKEKPSVSKKTQKVISKKEDLSDDDESDEEDHLGSHGKGGRGKFESEDSGFDNEDPDVSDDDDDDDSDSDYDFTNVTSTKKRKRKPEKQQVKKMDGIEVVPAAPTPNEDLKLDAEGLAIGTAMVESRKRRREIVDASYHRHMFDDTGLPEWFVSDEKKHVKRISPVSKEAIEEYRTKMKAVDAQPIKKIAEAKARKKRKMLKRQEKARKKANAVTDGVDVSEKEKWQQIKQIYKKAGLLKKTKPSVTYVVAKKGAGKKVRRPAGVKGQFKVVDPRLKKDMKAQKKAAKRSKSGGKDKKQKHRHSRK